MDRQQLQCLVFAGGATSGVFGGHSVYEQCCLLGYGEIIAFISGTGRQLIMCLLCGSLLVVCPRYYVNGKCI